MEMAQWLKGLSDLIENLGSIPDIYMTTHYCL